MPSTYSVIASNVTTGFDVWLHMSDGEAWLGNFETRKEARAFIRKDTFRS